MLDRSGGKRFIHILARISGNDFDNENGMMSRQRAATLRHQNRMRYAFGITNFLYRVNDRIHIFRKRVVNAMG